jgi:hypothetical protein
MATHLLHLELPAPDSYISTVAEDGLALFPPSGAGQVSIRFRLANGTQLDVPLSAQALGNLARGLAPFVRQ